MTSLCTLEWKETEPELSAAFKVSCAAAFSSTVSLTGASKTAETAGAADSIGGSLLILAVFFVILFFGLIAASATETIMTQNHHFL